ncbi:MAG: chromate efflux transporter [Verrucomicrobiia bacterium]|jgi:chromate transporter
MDNNALTTGQPQTRSASRRGCWEIFLVALRLGLTSFGGPVAHLGFFHSEYVVRRKWLDEAAYADLVALCQFLPGPASSQIGIGIGLTRGGLPGGLAAWLGFTLPSALAMIAFACGVAALGDVSHAGWLRGLKVAAVAVVAQAVWAMAVKLCPDRTRVTLALLAAICVLAWPSSLGQVLVIALGGAAGWFLFRRMETPPVSATLACTPSRAMGVAHLAAFFALLAALPAAAAFFKSQALAYFDVFYRCGSLVFGGGHVVLPLLQTGVVPPGWVSNDTFLAGYGAAQAVPGPLFTFAAYLGAAMQSAPNGWAGGFLCLAAVFLPSWLLMVGAMPFWDAFRKKPAAQAALKGTNAAVVGLLLAALYHPVWTSGIHDAREFILGLAAFGLLVFWERPAWLVVLLAAAGGWLMLTSAS